MTLVSSSGSGKYNQVPSWLSTKLPLPWVITRWLIVRSLPSVSLALANSSAAVMVRDAESSEMALNSTGLVVGASFTGVTTTPTDPV